MVAVSSLMAAVLLLAAPCTSRRMERQFRADVV
jgi:hypothetical protein